MELALVLTILTALVAVCLIALYQTIINYISSVEAGPPPGADIVYDENWGQNATFYQDPVTGMDESGYTIADGSSTHAEIRCADDGYANHFNDNRSSGPTFMNSDIKGDSTHTVMQIVVNFPTTVWVKNGHFGKRFRIRESSGGRGMGEWDMGAGHDGAYYPTWTFGSASAAHRFSIGVDQVVTCTVDLVAHTYSIEIDDIEVETDLAMTGSGSGNPLKEFAMWSTDEGEVDIGELLVADEKVL